MVRWPVVSNHRQTLENYLAVLKDAAVRSEARHFKETRHYMQDNLRLLSDFADANRNVRRLAFVVQHLQVLSSALSVVTSACCDHGCHNLL